VNEKKERENERKKRMGKRKEKVIFRVRECNRTENRKGRGWSVTSRERKRHREKGKRK
jgi:hypothetical protein